MKPNTSPIKSYKDGVRTLRFNPLSGLIRQVLVPFGLLAVPSVSVASPQGGMVTDGQGAIFSQGVVTTVHQNSQRLVTQWDSFNVDINEVVNFLQPSSSAMALARIIDQAPSQILGSISANGRLVLSNPNGLLFAPSATVNVGSLIASGLDITAGDFMAGNLRFDASGTGGTVINHGLLKAATGGSINLLGGTVVNTGTIVADYGEVNLGAGRTATLDFDGDGLIQFAVNGDLTGDENGSGSAISNSGVIQANGGQVLLLAHAAKDVFSQVINNSGVIRAQGIDTSGGKVRLVGSGGSVNNSGAVDVSAAGEGLSGGSIELKGETVAHTGVLSADARSGAGGSIDLQADNETLVSDGVISARSESAGAGGDVKILGNLVELTGSTSVDVSGANGGGTILVGGDLKGANPDINNAEETLVDEGVTLKADALNSGDGGKVIVWADGTTRFFGQLYARGGGVGGDGGFAEISGKQNLFINSLTDQIDVSAIAGLNGSLLLDPNDINITVGDDVVGTGNAVSGTPENANTLDDEDIADFLENTGSLTIETSGVGGNGDITIDDSVDIQWAAASALTLDASRDITFTGTATIAGTNAAADITFDADRNITLATTTVGSGSSATIAFNIGQGGVGGTLELGSAVLAAGDTVNASGAGGTNVFQLSAANVDLVTGGAGTDTIQAADAANTWNLTGAGVGDVGGSQFTGIENLTGGSDTDNFEFTSGGSVSGTVSGGAGGTDTLDYETDNFNAAVTINLQTLTATGTGGITNIDAVVGDSGFNASNVLVGADVANTWNITGADDGNIGGTFSFTDLGNLTGGSNTDNFEFASGSSVSGTVSGGAGGTDTLDYETDNFNAAVTVNLQALTATGTGGIANLDAVVGDSGFNASNGLVGADAANTWNITGADAGNIGGTFTFTDLGNLTGGSNTDNFEFASGSSVSGTVSGGAGGTDTLDYETDNFNSAVTVNLQTPAATGTGGIANIDAVVGDSGFNATNVLVGADAANTWNITGADDGNIGGTFSFTDLGNLTGGSDTDAFVLTGGGSVSVLITGSGGSDTVQGDDLANTWNLTGAGVGDVGGSQFTGIENLTGGSNTDNFEFASGSSVSGAVSGGAGGTDTLDYETDNFNAAVTVSLQTLTATGTGGIANIDAVVGDSGFNASNGLVGADAANTWNITGADAGNIGGTFSFTDLGNLTGGSDTDNFEFASGASVSGTVSGGSGGTDTLDYETDNFNAAVTVNLQTLTATGTGGIANIDAVVGDSGFNASNGLVGADAANTWNITGADAGNIGGTFTFTDLGNLTGGSDTDAFILTGGGSVSVLITGSGGSDTVQGDDLANTWNLTGAGVGDVGGSQFTGIENLTGGSNTDNFEFASGSSVSGTVSGGAGGTDTLDYETDNFNAAVTVNLQALTATGTGGITNIDAVVGDSGFNASNGLVGADAANTWNITGADAGNIGGTFSFTDLGNLTGGSNTDNFEFASGASVSGTVSGGSGGTDTLDYETDNFNAAVTVNLQTLTATGTGGIANIDAVVGDSGFNASNVLVGADAANTWNITGADAGNIGGTFSFTDMGNLTGGSNTDAFILTGGGSVSVLITGSGGSDTVQGDDLANTWNLTGAGVGDVGGSNFTGIENLTGGSNTDNFEFASGGSVSGTVSGGSGGTDTLDYETDNFNAAVTINLQTLTATGTGGIANIDAVVGDSGFNASNGLVGADAANTWNITGADAGNIGGTFSFTDLGNLTGGSNTDTFILSNAGSVVGVLDGQGGNDTLTGDDDGNAFSITGVNSGTLAGKTSGWTGIEALNGGTGVDSFTFANAGSLTGAVDGLGGNDVVIGDANGNVFTITGANAGTLAGKTSGWSNIEALTGGAGVDTFTYNNAGSLSGAVDGQGGNDTITGDADGNAFNITGANSGTLTGKTSGWSNIEALNGGAGDDAFTFGGAGSLAGFIDGAAHAAGDTVDYSAAVPLTVTIGTNFTNIETVTGGNAGFTLAGDVNFTITGADDGTAGSVAFIDFESLTGGAGNNSFTFTDAGNLSGSINGAGGGGDSLIGDSDGNAFNITGANSGTLTGKTSGWSNIEIISGGIGADTFVFGNAGSISGALTGGTGNDLLTGDANGSVFTVTGANTGTLAGKTSGWSGIEALTGGAGADSFSFANAGSLTGALSGAGGNDTLIGDANGNAFVVTGVGAGTLADSGGAPLKTSGWSGIENISGGAGTDTFNIQVANSLTRVDGVAGSDTVNLNGVGANAVGRILGADMTITSTGAIGAAGAGAQDIQVTSLTVTAGGNVFLNEATNLLIKSINAGANEVNLTASGSINDFTADNDTGIDITANRVVLKAGSGLGDDARLELGTTLLDARTTSGDVRIANNQALQLEKVTTGNGDIEVAAVGQLTVGDGTPGADVVVANSGNIALAADPGQTGSFDLIQRGNVNATNGTVLLLASGNVLADNPSNVVSVAQASFVVDTQQTSLIAGGFIGGTDGLNQTNAIATTSSSVFANQGGAGDAFLISGFGVTTAVTSGFDSNSLFGGVVSGALSLSFGASNSSVSNAAAGQASAAAGESQNADVSDEGYIDPALYDLSLNIFDTVQGGILLPQDQLEGGGDGVSDSTGNADLGLDEEVFETTEEFEAIDLGPEPELFEELPVENDFGADVETLELIEEPVVAPNLGDDEFDLEEFDLEDFDEDSLELEFEGDEEEFESFDEDFDIEALEPLTINHDGYGELMRVHYDNSQLWERGVVTLIVGQSTNSKNPTKSI